MSEKTKRLSGETFPKAVPPVPSVTCREGRMLGFILASAAEAAP